MKKITQHAWGWMVLAFFGLLVFPAPASARPLKAGELNRFIADSAPFFDWVRTNHEERMLNQLMHQPQSITKFPQAVRFLKSRKWDPERFAYILNHVMIAYQRLALGKDPDRVLRRLEETKIGVEKDHALNKSEKARTLSLIAQAQHAVRKTDKAFAALPAAEVRLIWRHRAELHQALDGRLPIKQRRLPNPAHAK